MSFRQQLSQFGLGVAGGLLVLGGYVWLQPQGSGPSFMTGGEPVNYAQFARFKGTGGTSGNQFVVASQIATPAVVHIKTSNKSPMSGRRNEERDMYDDFFRDFFGDRGQGSPGSASGSGVIISTDGYIVTNNHVIEGADKIEVTMNDNKSYTASLVGTDPSTDLAVLKISETNLPMLKFGDSDGLQVGEWVLAVGNPFNLTSTVTAGIVSAKARSINILSDKFKIESFIQTDAVVNPGNSGGALINERAELVGINTAIFTQTGSYSGYSFAVPSLIVKKVVDDLINYGNVQRGFLGVMISDVNSELAKKENLGVSQGIYVTEVNKGSAAEAAGLRKGDVIQKVDNITVTSSSSLQEQIGKHRPGDKVNVTYLRDGEVKSAIVELKNQAGGTQLVKSESDPTLQGLGATVEVLTSDQKTELNVKNGLKITELRPGKLRNAGIREGFVITKVDKKPVNTKEDLASVLKNREGAVLIEGLYEAGDLEAFAIIF